MHKPIKPRMGREKFPLMVFCRPGLPCRGKRRRAAAVQNAGAFSDDDRTARSVLECASPLALWISFIKPTHDFTAGCFLPRLRRRGRPVSLKFFRGREGQAAFAVEQLLQPPVLGTALTPDDAGHDTFAHFTTITPPFQPVIPTDRSFNRDAGDFGF